MGRPIKPPRPREVCVAATSVQGEGEAGEAGSAGDAGTVGLPEATGGRWAWLLGG